MKRPYSDKTQTVETSIQTEESELNGYLGLEMRKEALMLARKILKKQKLSEKAFKDCLTVVESYAARPRLWRELLESAHQNLSAAGRKNVRFRMLIFFDAKIKDDAATLRFGSKRLTKRSNMVEILLVWNCWVRLKEMKKLAETIPVISAAIRSAAYASMRSFLANAYAGYWALRLNIEKQHELEMLAKSFKEKITADSKSECSELHLSGIQPKTFRS
jgi:hypothetical protein